MPMWARSEQFNNWHPGHIAERYGLLTIIVLGEGVVGVSNSIQYFLVNSASAASSIMFLGSSLVALVFSLWWLYFIVPFATILNKERRRHQRSWLSNYLPTLCNGHVGGYVKRFFTDAYDTARVNVP